MDQSHLDAVQFLHELSKVDVGSAASASTAHTSKAIAPADATALIAGALRPAASAASNNVSLVTAE